MAAWMDIGIAGRLAISLCRFTTIRPSEDLARACWSAFVLDRIYGSSFSMAFAIPTEALLPECPTSHPVPQSRQASVNADRAGARSSSQPEGVVDIGIDACCFRLLSIWGQTTNYIQSIKEAKAANAWPGTEAYQAIINLLYKFEMSIGFTHRIRNLRLYDRSFAQLESERGYWGPWFAMQFLYHSTQALINHPFLHLMKSRKDRSVRPPSFLQHTVDQILLHSSWLTKFVHFLDKKSFHINDPFLAHLISITATGHLFFLNSEDRGVAQQAQDGFNTCYGFVKEISNAWPHLKNTVRMHFPFICSNPALATKRD